MLFDKSIMIYKKGNTDSRREFFNIQKIAGS